MRRLQRRRWLHSRRTVPRPLCCTQGSGNGSHTCTVLQRMLRRSKQIQTAQGLPLGRSSAPLPDPRSRKWCFQLPCPILAPSRGQGSVKGRFGKNFTHSPGPQLPSIFRMIKSVASAQGDDEVELGCSLSVLLPPPPSSATLVPLCSSVPQWPRLKLEGVKLCVDGTLPCIPEHHQVNSGAEEGFRAKPLPVPRRHPQARELPAPNLNPEAWRGACAIGRKDTGEWGWG